MALVVYDRVQETTATTGTGTLTLGGAVAGYQDFSVVGNGNTTFYCILNGSAWEVGIGTYSTTGPTLARTTVLSNSSGTTSPITLVGASTVFCTYPAEKSVNLNADGVLAVGSPIGYVDTGIIATFASTEAGYNQVIVQNKSNATNASANINISNDVSTDTTGFAELGINSSQFTGTGSFSIAGAAYLASAGTDLTIGTYSAHDIHIVTNSNTVDAMTIHDDGGIALGGLADPGIGNIACNNINLKFQQIVTAGGTTTLTNASPYFTQFTGTSTQDLILPDATTCLVGTTFIFDNDSTQNVTIKDATGTTFELLIPGGYHNFVLEQNATVAGTWLRYSSVPSTVEWGTNSLQLASTVITGGVWNGGTIGTGYGGTGLTSYTSGGAVYATSSSTLTSGTLPVTAGGTGQTSFASGYIPYGNSSAALQSSASLQFNGTYLVVGGGTPITGSLNPIATFIQSANNYVQTYTYNPNSGTSASADFACYPDNGTDTSGFVDMGVASSTYAEPSYSVTGPNEAYVLGSAPSGAGATGNLVYATDSTGSANAHQWYVGGFNQAKGAWKMQLTSTGLQLANALAVTYGGTGATTASGARTNLGATTVGSNFFTLTDPSAITFPRINADNTVSALDAATFRTAIGAGTSSTTGTVTSVATGSGLTGGTITTTGTINLDTAYGDTVNPYGSKTANYVLAAPNGSAGTPSFRALVAADIPALSYAPTAGSTSITSLGTVTVGTWNANVIGTTYTSAKVTDVQAGTGVSVSATTGSVTVSIPQAVATTSSVQFGSFGVGTAASGTSGEIRATNNVTAYYSDMRFKDKIGNIDNALDKVMALSGFYYEANELAQSYGYEKKREVGVSAQEVQAVMPEVVAPAPIDENYLTVRYERLVPLLIEAIKELKAEVNALKAK